MIINVFVVFLFASVNIIFIQIGGVVKSGVYACLSRRRSRVRIPSSPLKGQIAQSVEHLSEKQGVGSSILPLATVKQKKFNVLILNIKILHIQTLNQ